MSNELASALLKESGLRVVVAVTTEIARKAQALHRAHPASAAMLAQGLTAGALLGALQKGDARINLQLECDGPLRGLFVDANAQGQIRGYPKNGQLDVKGTAGVYEWRPVLGNSGYLSVLRDLGGGEHYHSSVELTRFDLAQDLERYFEVSEQIPTRVALELLPDGEDPLGTVAGLLVQTLPDGDREVLRELADRAHAGAFRAALARHGSSGAMGVATELFGTPDFEVMSSYPLSFSCSCSQERVRRALLAMGKAELTDVLHKDGKAEVTCQFCGTQYQVSRQEIEALLATAAD